MVSTRRYFQVGAASVLGGALILFIAQSGFVPNPLTTEGFEPHGHCFLWIPSLTRLYSISDLLIGCSYLVISAILTSLVYKASRNIPFDWVFLAFGAFIFTCGMTHFMDVYTLWTPTYWLAGYTKALTAIASVTTAVLLPPLVPKVLVMVDAAKASEQRRRALTSTNQALELEIAERQRVEDELREALRRERELSHFRSMFVTRMSHEFRTPLAIAMTSSELLKNYNDRMTQEQRLERLDKIQVEIRHMTTLLDDILMIGRINAGKVEAYPAPVALDELCATTAKTVELSAETHTVECAVEGDCTDAVMDGNLIRQMLMHLLSNAVKFSKPGTPVHLQLTCSEGRAVFTIRDQGVGIAPEDQEYLFDGFYRGKNANTIAGTGVGLTIARHIIQLHGGSIAVKSAVGEGSTFTVTIPLTPPS